MLHLETNLIGAGMYGLPEASRLTGVPAARIRRWLTGYRYNTLSGQVEGSAVLSPELPIFDGIIAASFLDLIEVRIVNALRQRGMSWRLIRAAARNARELFGVDHPFATRSFKTDGRSIFASMNKTHGERALIDLAANQLTFRTMIEPTLKNVEFDATHRAARLWPLGLRRRVLLDPRRNFGQPIVREGVPTRILSLASKRDGSVATVAKWYEVEVRAVRDAIDFESKFAA